MRGNSLGFLVTGDLEFSGGQLLDFSNNLADFVQQEAIKVIRLNYKRLAS